MLWEPQRNQPHLLETLMVLFSGSIVHLFESWVWGILQVVIFISFSYFNWSLSLQDLSLKKHCVLIQPFLSLGKQIIMRMGFTLPCVSPLC